MKPKLLIFSLLAACASAQVGLGLSPMRLELNLQPGATHSGALDLTNEVDATLRVRGELLDFQIDETTTPQFLRHIPSEAAHSCREWLTANPMETEVDPKQHLIVRYTIRVPLTAPPHSYHCAVGYTTLPPSGIVQSTALRTAVRIVASFYVIVGPPTIQGELSGLIYEQVPTAKAERWRAVLLVRNRGDYHFRPTGAIDLISEGGAILESIQLPSFPALPQREQRYVMPVTFPNPTEVRRLKAVVDLGNHELQEASIDVARPAPAQ